MTELDQVLEAAFKSEGARDDVNKVYLTLLRSSLFIPVEKQGLHVVDPENEEEQFKPLFALMDDKYFMLAFDTVDRLKGWAGDQMDMIAYVELIGRDLIAGISEQVYLCLNIGTDFYKEFSPDEVVQVKKIVARIDQMKDAQA
jgi:hypothetical protein